MNNIATLRKQREMTQTDLAAQIGISQGTLSQYESGKRTPDSKTLIKLSEFFNCTPNYILGLPEEKSINIDVSKLSMTDVTAITEVGSFKRMSVCVLAGGCSISAKNLCGMKMGADMGKLYMYWGGLVTLQMQKYQKTLIILLMNGLISAYQ